MAAAHPFFPLPATHAQTTRAHIHDHPTVEGLSLGKFSVEVNRIEEEIRRRLPMGSAISERSIRDALVMKDYPLAAINKALFILTQKQTLQYESRRMVLRRVML